MFANPVFITPGISTRLEVKNLTGCSILCSCAVRFSAVLVAAGHVDMGVNKLRRGGRSSTKFRWLDDEILLGVGTKFLLQTALMFLGYDYIILRAKQVHCLESLYLKWDLLAIKLPKGYGKSLVFQVLPYLLNERVARKALSSQEGPLVVLVVSPLNSLMYD